MHTYQIDVKTSPINKSGAPKRTKTPTTFFVTVGDEPG
jgi:hypothetical protein